MRVIKDMLKKCNSNDTFKCRLAKVLLQYRSSSLSTTHISPSISLNKRRYVTVKDCVNSYYCQSTSCKVSRVKQFDVGDNILALNLREGAKW